MARKIKNTIRQFDKAKMKRCFAAGMSNEEVGQRFRVKAKMVGMYREVAEKEAENQKVKDVVDAAERAEKKEADAAIAKKAMAKKAEPKKPEAK